MTFAEGLHSRRCAERAPVDCTRTTGRCCRLTVEVIAADLAEVSGRVEQQFGGGGGSVEVSVVRTFGTSFSMLLNGTRSG